MEMRRLQESVSLYNKSLSLDDQMKIINLVEKIQRRCRPILNKWFAKQLAIKYPFLKKMPVKLKNLARDKTEKTIRKYSY